MKRAFELLFFCLVATAAGSQPVCTIPVDPAQVSIAYRGSVSGCTAQNIAMRPCITGEFVTFNVVPEADPHCLLVYKWDLPDGSAILGPSTTFQFPSLGTFPVVLTVTSPINAIQKTQMVPVASPSTIPAMGTWALAILAVSLCAFGIGRL
jgi:hypothetical protein